MTIGMSATDLEDVLDRGEAAFVVEWFAGRSEAERRSVAPQVLRWATAGERGELGHGKVMERSVVATPALLGCATWTELRRIPPEFMAPGLGDESFLVLGNRCPEWIPLWVDALLDRQVRAPNWARNDPSWYFCRRLIRAGLCPTPTSDSYILGLISQTRTNAAHLLAEDEGLLKHEIWRFFEVEGRPRGRNLTSYGQHWAVTLARHAATGTISRERLIDATLDALARDFSAYNARWYEQFHVLLAPSEAEVADRTRRYVHLLGSRNSTTASLALEALEALEAAGALAADEVVPGVDRAFSGAKVTATRALRLLGQLLERLPDLRPEGVRQVQVALGHAQVDVQRVALDLVDRYLDRDDLTARADLLADAELVAPSLQPRLRDLMGIDIQDVDHAPAARVVEFKEVELRAQRVDPKFRRLAGVDDSLAAYPQGFASGILLPAGRIPVPAPTSALTPIEDIDELVAVLSRLVEVADDADEVERSLDGVSRLCAERPPGFEVHSGPLRKRVLSLVRPRFSGSDLLPFDLSEPRDDLCGVVKAWLTGEDPSRQLSPSPPHLLSYRAHEVATRAARREPRPLLSAPTHRGGWIDPMVLASRLGRYPGSTSMSPVDATQAVLRVAPWRSASALPLLQHLSGEIIEAMRFALGDPAISPRGESPTPDVWWAAERVRSASAGTNRPSSPLPGARNLCLPMNAGQRWPPVTRAGVRWRRTSCPVDPEPLLVQATAWMTSVLDEPRTYESDACLEPLLDPDVALGVVGSGLLVLGLASKELSRRATASDVFIAAAEDGRLDVDVVGEVLGSLLDQDIVDAGRVVPALADAGRLGVLHAELVRRVLEACLREWSPGPPARLYRLLELLVELCSDAGTGVSRPRARTSLRCLAERKSKTGQLARRLLEADQKTSRYAMGASLAAAEGRILRAERWEASARGWLGVAG